MGKKKDKKNKKAAKEFGGFSDRESRFPNDEALLIRDFTELFGLRAQPLRDLIHEAGSEPVKQVKVNQRFYRKEVTYAVFQLQQRKIKQSRSMKNVSVENQSPLEKSRNEQVMIKNEILKKEWAPIRVMEASLAVHNAQLRTMAISVKPQLRQKFGQLVSMEALAEIETFFFNIMNKIARLELDDEYLKEAIEDQAD